ncbi:hypothetical protein XELAEV_18046396mg [Xenopus laevis]|uniref:Uncharacterized protein n=1 Tax=Xenopus laevis TaxID=8355 RepID=A0A974H0J9_XENLA|nr:hypothetical protein XELAEV_18046396mg [Xenopus laevis]
MQSSQFSTFKNSIFLLLICTGLLSTTMPCFWAAFSSPPVYRQVYCLSQHCFPFLLLCTFNVSSLKVFLTNPLLLQSICSSRLLVCSSSHCIA